MQIRSCVTLADGRQMHVAIAAAPLERLLTVGAPGRIGLYDEHGRCWVWLELSEVSCVAPLGEASGSEPWR
jgi:hypothetical protein